MSLRSILFDLFHGQEFQEVKADIKTILSNTTQVMADLALMAVAVATLSQEVAALDLAGLTDKVDKLLQPGMSIWTESVVFQNALETVSIPVLVKGDPLGEIVAFGFGVSFDPAELRFVQAIHGSGTISWQAVDGNETQPGAVVVGGFAGSGASLIGDNPYMIAYLDFEVLVDTDVNFQLNSYVDDITGVRPEPYYGVIIKGSN